MKKTLGAGQRIFKYVLPLSDDPIVPMPIGAEVISAQGQDLTPVIWAIVDPDQPTVQRRFRIVGTGHPCEDVDFDQFVGTVQLHGERLVFHVFDMGEVS